MPLVGPFKEIKFDLIDKNYGEDAVKQTETNQTMHAATVKILAGSYQFRYLKLGTLKVILSHVGVEFQLLVK